MTFKSIIAALAIAALPVAALAQAGGREVTVSYDDLNLTSKSGAAVLLSRIEAAAERVCGPRPGLLDLASQQAYRRCIKETMDRAVSDVGAPLVAELHRGRQIASN